MLLSFFNTSLQNFYSSFIQPYLQSRSAFSKSCWSIPAIFSATSIEMNPYSNKEHRMSRLPFWYAFLTSISVLLLTISGFESGKWQFFLTVFRAHTVLFAKITNLAQKIFNIIRKVIPFLLLLVYLSTFTLTRHHNKLSSTPLLLFFLHSFFCLWKQSINLPPFISGEKIS